jgi:cell division protein FtsA
MPVRLGVPQYVGGLAEVVKNPRYSTCLGLLLAGFEQHNRNHLVRMQTSGLKQILERMKQWFSGNF